MDQQKTKWEDKEILLDMLHTQRYLTHCYNESGNHATDPKIRDELQNLLSEEHQIIFDLLNELTKRGWYAVEQAQITKIEQVKQDFSAKLLDL